MSQNFRSTTLLVCAMTLVATVAADAQAQQGRRSWRFYGDNYSVGVALLQEEKVQAELKLTSDQIAKANEIREQLSEDRREVYSGVSRDEWRERGEELRKKTTELAKTAAMTIADLLDDAQKTRWVEVTLQVRGPAALPGDMLAERLKLEEGQIKKLDELAAAQRDKMFELWRQFQDQGLSTEERTEKVTALVKETNAQRMAVLNDEQKATFKELQGEKFELPEE